LIAIFDADIADVCRCAAASRAIIIAAIIELPPFRFAAAIFADAAITFSPFSLMPPLRHTPPRHAISSLFAAMPITLSLRLRRHLFSPFVYFIAARCRRRYCRHDAAPRLPPRHFRAAAASAMLHCRRRRRCCRRLLPRFAAAR
jgi:hypothetical protein